MLGLRRIIGCGRAVFLPVLLLLSANVSAASAANVVLPDAAVMDYCAIAGCDSQVFYRYYEAKKNRFCAEGNVLLEHTNHAGMLRYLVSEASKVGLPVTVAVLPILESSLNPRAVASDHPNAAKGLWQFKPETARDMGLQVGVRLDERLDVARSTAAGMKYIQWLENQFDGDHNLAVLAYHVGVGSVTRMIERYHTKNPWFLSRLISDNKPDKDYLMKYYSYSLALMKKGCDDA